MSVDAKLSKLSLNLNNTQAPNTFGTTLSSRPVATPESWEDGLADDVPVEAPGPSLKPITSNEAPAPPPPTPSSPLTTDPFSRRSEAMTAVETGLPTPRPALNTRDSDKRPEKTTSTANRMIAGALGIKAPKKTEEQKQYDKALKEAEIKRKSREKEQREREKLDDQHAQAAVWDS